MNNCFVLNNRDIYNELWGYFLWSDNHVWITDLSDKQARIIRSIDWLLGDPCLSPWRTGNRTWKYAFEFWDKFFVLFKNNSYDDKDRFLFLLILLK